MSDATQHPQGSQAEDGERTTEYGPIFVDPSLPPIQLSALERGIIYELVSSKGRMRFGVVALDNGIPQCHVLEVWGTMPNNLTMQTIWLKGWTPTPQGVRQGIKPTHDVCPGDEAELEATANVDGETIAETLGCDCTIMMYQDSDLGFTAGQG